MDQLLDARDYEKIMSFGCLTGVTTLEQILILNRELIRQITDTESPVSEEGLVRAEAVSDTVDIVLEYIHDIKESQNKKLGEVSDEVDAVVRETVRRAMQDELNNEE